MKTTTYSYNDDSSVASIVYPFGDTIAYGVDVMAHPISATDTTNNIAYASQAVYTAPGELTSLQNGSNVTTSAYFNDRLQPCRIAVSTAGVVPGACSGSNTGNILDISYNFNLGGADNGNVMSVTNNIDNTRSQAFSYDALNRLLNAQTASTYSTSPTKCWGESYSYDPWANLLGTTVPGADSSCTQESPGPGGPVQTNNRLSAASDSYDAAGNTIAEGTCTSGQTLSYQNTLTYNAENQLVTAVSESGANGCTAVITSYTYDGDGNRVEKSSGTIYWYGAGSVLDETNLQGTTTNEYVFFGGKRIARRDSSGNVFYYFDDQLGTAHSIVEVPTGQTNPMLCYDADYYPFGGERWYTDSCDSHFKFTGKERDAESGLDNFGARYNSSSLGRFMSPDWSGAPEPVPYANFINPQTLNLYAMARDNPETFADLDGHGTGNCGGYPAEEQACENRAQAAQAGNLCGGAPGCYQTTNANGVTTVKVYSSTEPTTTTNADGSKTVTGTSTVQTYNFNRAGEMTSADQNTEVRTSTISPSGSMQTQTSETSTALNVHDAMQHFGIDNVGAFQKSFIDTRGTLARFPGTVAADAKAHPWAYAYHAVEFGALFVPVAGEMEAYKSSVEVIVGVASLLNELGDPSPNH